MLLSHHSQIIESAGFSATFSPSPQRVNHSSWYIGFNSVLVVSDVSLDYAVVLQASLVYNSTRLFGVAKSEPLHVFHLKTEQKEPDVHVAFISLNSAKLFHVNAITNPVKISLQCLDTLLTSGTVTAPLQTTTTTTTVPPPKYPKLYVHMSMYKSV